jgi:hypothetical protein
MQEVHCVLDTEQVKQVLLPAKCWDVFGRDNIMLKE